MSVVNLMANHIWSEQDIVAHGRAMIASQVSAVRQAELQMIFLGHTTGQRVATDEELAEIALLTQLTQEQSAANVGVRSDMALLLSVMAYEEAKLRLAKEPLVSENLEAVVLDSVERGTAQALVDAAPLDVQVLYAERNPTSTVEVQNG